VTVVRRGGGGGGRGGPPPAEKTSVCTKKLGRFCLALSLPITLHNPDQ
jgi:hypothetical protein